MTALPLTQQHRGEDRLELRLAGHEQHYITLWEATGEALGPPQRRIRWRQKRSNARHARRLIDEIAHQVEHYPVGALEQTRWRHAVRRRVRDFGERHLGWPAGYRRLLVADEFWETTVEFVRSARRFAPRIAPADLFQALRNVWIINSIQLLLDLEVRCSRPAFAYSMLYPWTDNFLDSPATSGEAKRAFNGRLFRRLRGEATEATSRHEAEIFDLVAMIEADLPRHRYPDAYRSLLAIQRGQQDSLRQQGGPCGTADLLRISLRKGGSSVLPDAYLVAGTLTQEEESFFFGYGVFLQLLDDLQDVSEDLAAGHETLFTLAARHGWLDAPTARLKNFIDKCLRSDSRFSGHEFRDRRDLIRRNCMALLVGAVAEQSELFSRDFRCRLESDWPLSLRSLRHLRRSAERRFRAAGETLSSRHKGVSWLDLLSSEAVPRD